MMEILACSEEHIPEAVELWKEYMVDQGDDPLSRYFDFEASTEGFHRILEGYMKKEPDGFLVATSGDEVVGFVVSFKDAFGPNYVMKARVRHIQVVHTKRGHRRKGVATRLMEAALDYLRENGCTLVLAEIGEGNANSVGMLRKLGFKERDKIVNLMKEIR